jgi:hypothetical protein
MPITPPSVEQPALKDASTHVDQRTPEKVFDFSIMPSATMTHTGDDDGIDASTPLEAVTEATESPVEASSSNAVAALIQDYSELASPTATESMPVPLLPPISELPPTPKTASPPTDVVYACGDSQDAPKTGLSAIPTPDESTPRSSMDSSVQTASPPGSPATQRKKSPTLLSSLVQAPAAVAIAGTEYRVEMRKTSPVLSRRSQFLRRVGLGGNDEDREPAVSDAANNGDRNSLVIRQGKKMFTVYKVMVKCEGRQWAVYKRYSEFDTLDKQVHL